MAFTQQAELKGFNRVFKVNSTCKPYTLRDNGFTETTGGNYQYKRPLNTQHRDGLAGPGHGRIRPGPCLCAR